MNIMKRQFPSAGSQSKILILVSLIFLVACSSVPAVPTSAGPVLTPTPQVIYKSIQSVGYEPATFELPEGWDFWGNAGWLSPDDGRTFAGLRMAWVKPGQDAERLLFNEDAVILDRTDLMIAGTEVHRYTVEVYKTVAATNERSLQGYEMIYAFPAADPEQVAGMFVSAPSQEELDLLAPIAEHMVETLKWEEQ